MKAFALFFDYLQTSIIFQAITEVDKVGNSPRANSCDISESCEFVPLPFVSKRQCDQATSPSPLAEVFFPFSSSERSRRFCAKANQRSDSPVPPKNQTKDR